jgi:hypothetical protein
MSDGLASSNEPVTSNGGIIDDLFNNDDYSQENEADAYTNQMSSEHDPHTNTTKSSHHNELKKEPTQVSHITKSHSYIIIT